jgi:hypothetical protein
VAEKVAILKPFQIFLVELFETVKIEIVFGFGSEEERHESWEASRINVVCLDGLRPLLLSFFIIVPITYMILQSRFKSQFIHHQ